MCGIACLSVRQHVGICYAPDAKQGARDEKVSQLWFVASRDLESREQTARKSRCWVVLKRRTRGSERKGGGTKKLLFHHNFVEGLDTQKAAFSWS